MKTLFFTAMCLVFSFSQAQADQANQAKWTMLVFINGHNDLDSYGTQDMNEMETVGSTKDINVVTQWASLKSPTTNRYLVQKDNSPQVTSTPVQKLPRVDMGDYKSLVDFVKWGVANYPADQYFLVVWNHGRGWKRFIKPKDARNISSDDLTGNSITTEQLGTAMSEVAQVIGKPLDVYSSDACLMAMPEISAEMDKTVNYFIGSEELEPGPGWPYDKILEGWNKTPDMSMVDLSKLITYEFRKSYEDGSQGYEQVTLSAYDLSKSKKFYQALFNFGREVKKMSAADKSKVLDAVDSAQYFEYSYYRDLIDVVNKIESRKTALLSTAVIADLKAATSEFVIANETTSAYKTSYGVSVWFPTSLYDFADLEARYSNLNFNKETEWHSMLKSLY